MEPMLHLFSEAGKQSCFFQDDVGHDRGDGTGDHAGKDTTDSFEKCLVHFILWTLAWPLLRFVQSHNCSTGPWASPGGPNSSRDEFVTAAFGGHQEYRLDQEPHDSGGFQSCAAGAAGVGRCE